VRTVGDLLSEQRVSSFGTLLRAYRDAGHELRNGVDGGAGSGSTAKAMARCLSGDVYAFEPFPGNYRFFVGADPRVRLMPFALASEPGRRSFAVSSTVSADSEWGQRGMEGYSSVGRLVEDGDFTVECVRADDAVTQPVDFVKLDLQGGELDALKGMPRILSEAEFLWVEFCGSEELFSFLLDQDFAIFDAQYVLIGERDEGFSVAEEAVTLSTGKAAWKGYRRARWEPYDAVFREKVETGLVQTDLVCVRRERLETFSRIVTGGRDDKRRPGRVRRNRERTRLRRCDHEWTQLRPDAISCKLCGLSKPLPPRAVSPSS
jgi:FkbM family methyltransferase